MGFARSQRVRTQWVRHFASWQMPTEARAGFNFSRWVDTTFDKAITTAGLTPDLDERRVHYQAAMEANLFNSNSVTGVSKVMLDEKELEQVRNYIHQILPQMIRQEPDTAIALEGLLAQHFPRRDEFARLLDKLDQNQAETNQRFEQVDQRFSKLDQDVLSIKRDVLSIKRDVAQLHSGQDLLFRKLDQRDAELLLRYGDLGNIKGKALEDMFAVALRYGLRNPDIQPDQIKLRQPIEDPEGLIFRPGYVSEIDLIAQNGRLILFEVKATSVVDHVDLFASKVDLIKLQQPDKVIHAVFISLDAEQVVSQRCQALDLELVDSLEDKPSSV